MNDELAAFQAEVRGAFAEMRQEFAALRGEMRQEFIALDRRFTEGEVILEKLRGDLRWRAEFRRRLDQVERLRRENDTAHQATLALIRASYRDLGLEPGG